MTETPNNPMTGTIILIGLSKLMAVIDPVIISTKSQSMNINVRILKLSHSLYRLSL
jgi:hypothetical protein